MNKLISKFVILSFTKLDIGLENQKDGKDLTIRKITRPGLRKALDDGDITRSNVDTFRSLINAPPPQLIFILKKFPTPTLTNQFFLRKTKFL